MFQIDAYTLWNIISQQQNKMEYNSVQQYTMFQIDVYTLWNIISQQQNKMGIEFSPAIHNVSNWCIHSLKHYFSATK